METILKMPGSNVLKINENDRLTDLSSSSKRNSEVFFRKDDEQLSSYSRDIDLEDPFYDTTMRTRGTNLPKNIPNQPSFGENIFRPNLKPQKSFEFMNRQLDLINKRNMNIRESMNSTYQVFQNSKVSSKINDNKLRFFKMATQFKGVCLARCSPSMKSLVTEVLCQQMNKIVLAIGDGGNDVGMIQISNVGVGIIGKEGNQAALAADFNISQFR